MKSYTIPFIDFPYFTQQITLSDVSYTFTFRWNSYDAAWFLTISDDNGNDLVSSIRMVLSHNLLENTADTGVPPGALIVVDPAGGEALIGQDDFINERALELIYLYAE